MKATIDGRPLEGAGETLSSALAAALDNASGRLIVEALADGTPVPREHLESPPDRAPYAELIEFVTAEPLALIKMTLYEAADELDEVLDQQGKAGELVQSGQVENAMPLTAQVIEGWQRVRHAVELAAGTGLLDPDQVGGELTTLTCDLAALLVELRKALETQDWVGVSDILAYDLGDQARSWRTWLSSSAEALPRLA